MILNRKFERAEVFIFYDPYLKIWHLEEVVKEELACQAMNRRLYDPIQRKCPGVLCKRNEIKEAKRTLLLNEIAKRSKEINQLNLEIEDFTSILLLHE